MTSDELFKNAFLLRLAVVIIFLSHSLHGIIKNDVNDFGNLFLNQVGFAPFGVIIAWGVILSQVVGSVLLLFNKYVRIVSAIFILTLIAGIILVHYPEGWYVVGGGRNGMEFSFLLIVTLLAIMFPEKNKN